MATSLVSTGVTFPDGTTQTTAATGGGGVTSLNGQTGAITNTAKNAIGSYVWAYPGIRNTSSTVYTFGSSTVSGTVLGTYIFNGTYNYYTCFGQTQGGYYPQTPLMSVSNMTNLGLTGTWRAMGNSKNWYGTFTKDSGDSAVSINLWVRVS